MYEDEFSSPRKDDKLFRGDLPDWHNNACISPKGSGNLLAYVEGYRRGADILVRYVNENGRDQDFLVYPVVFLYRHHLELAMKRIIRRLPRLLDRSLTSHEEHLLKRHDLSGLWRVLKPMVTQICEAVDWAHPEKDDLEGADEHVRQLSEVDPDSMSFRYAQTKDGNNSLPEGLTHINLRHFAKTVSRLAEYIDGIDTATSQVAEWQDDMEAGFSY